MARLRDLMRAAERPGFAMPGWLERITSFGIVSDDPQVVRRQRFTNLGAYAAAANAGSHLVINAMHGPASLMPVQLYNAAFADSRRSMVPLLHRFGPDIGAFCLDAARSSPATPMSSGCSAPRARCMSISPLPAPCCSCSASSAGACSSAGSSWSRWCSASPWCWRPSTACCWARTTRCTACCPRTPCSTPSPSMRC